MGASDWEYFVPWQRDVRAAFRALQAQEAGGKKPLEVLAAAGLDMTHSILDIALGISEKEFEPGDPDNFMMGFAAAHDWILKTYGTLRPTRRMIEANADALGEYIERGAAVYFAAWESEEGTGDPKWWYFYGCSGD
jgi:hypothetical protein